jgi:hypothetical protein
MGVGRTRTMSLDGGQGNKSTNQKTIQLVKLLTELGPDIPEISRKLGQFKESVRYRYKEKILNKGLAVQATVDHERIGLRRLIVVIDFSDVYSEYAPAILTSMSELCFLVDFAKTMPTAYFVANFSIPKEFVAEVKSFLEAMKEKGMFSRLEIYDFDWMRVSPMKSEFYDFDTGRWDFDWTGQSPDYTSAKYLPSPSSPFDYVDLLLLKELQMDANKSLKEISDKLQVNYKKLAWHYAAHVKARHLLRGYSVNWMGTKYDYGMEKVLQRQHRYFALNLLIRGVDDHEIVLLRQAIDRLPYLWAEAVGRNYFVEMAFPVDFVVEGLQFLTKTVSTFKERAQIYAIDQTNAASFTIPYGQFDFSRKKWIFDSADLMRRFEALIVQINKETH